MTHSVLLTLSKRKNCGNNVKCQCPKYVISLQMNEVCYDKTVGFLRKGKQVMVFVHARNATVKTGMMLKEMAQNKGRINN